MCWVNEPDRPEAGPTGDTGFQPVAVTWEALEGGVEILIQQSASPERGGACRSARRTGRETRMASTPTPAWRCATLTVALWAALGCAGCGDDDSPRFVSAPTPTATPVGGGASCADPAVQAAEPLCALDARDTPCEFLNDAHCLLPYPSAYFLRPDPATATGLRVNYPRTVMPANTDGVHIDPTEWNTLDGFSPGPILVATFPQGVDLTASGVAPLTDIARSVDAASPTVLLDAASGERIPHFAELDVQASTAATQAFMIRPAVRLRNATRYVVAIRGLKSPAGDPVAPPRPFQILRDRQASPVAALNARRAHFEEVFDLLQRAGVDRDTLLLAWDFTTASTRSLTGRALAVRDRGLAANGPGAPPFTVTAVDDNYSADIFRRVRGRFTVPLFTTRDKPPTPLNLDADGVPRQNGTTTAPFTVIIPRRAVGLRPPSPGRALVYGHGLLGSGEGEITADHLQRLANRCNFVVAATDWVGMASEDFTPTLRLTAELSNFHVLPDRLQQAMLNFVLLTRLLTAADGLGSHPAFQFEGVPIIDRTEAYFYGNSQGGIEGGAYMALATETVRGVLGVGAANYSLLLQRSIDFARFQFPLYQHYEGDLDRALLYPLIQQLWDRGEPQAYLPHLVTDPLPGTPAKKILMQFGLHDSQVSQVASEIAARSLGIPNLAPTVLPLFQVAERVAPYDGSAVVVYDVGGTATPQTNTAPERDNGVHEAVRRLDAAQRQIDAFLRPDGTIQNYCDGPCVFRNVPGVE